MRRTATVMLFWLGSTAAFAQQLPDRAVTLPELIEYLRDHAPAILSLRDHLAAVRDNELTASLRPNPIFSSANEDFNLNPNRFDIVNAQEFTQNVSELFERGHKRPLRVESAKLGTVVATDQVNDAVRQLQFQVQSAYVSVLLAHANLTAAEENLRDYQQIVEANRVRLQGGDISETDFSRILLQESQFQSDLMAAQLAVAQAREQMAGLLGLELLPAHFDVRGTLDVPPLAITQQQLQQDALANRPDYLAARDGIGKAQADLKLAFANGATDFTFGGEYKRNGPENTVGFTLQIPLRIFDHNQGEKARTQHELEASRANELAVHAQVISDVNQAWEAYQSAIARAHLYTGTYLNLARTVRERIEFSFKNGGTSLLDYLDAVRSYRDTELASRTANAQALTAIYQLSFVSGTELLK